MPLANLGQTPITAREIGEAVGEVIAPIVTDLPQSSPANLQPIVEGIEQLRTDENTASTQASNQAGQRKAMLDQIRDRGTATNNLLTQILAALADGDEATTAGLLTAILAALAPPLAVHVDNPTDLAALVAAVTGATDEPAVDKLELIQALLAGTLKVSGPITDTQLRATPLAVLGPLTDVQLRATPLAVEIANDVGAPITVAGIVTAMPTRGAWTDRSAAISAAGTAQNTAAVANPARTFLSVHNPSLTADLWFNIGGAATKGAGSTRLLPGGTATYESGFIPTGAVAVLSDAAGPFTIKEG